MSEAEIVKFLDPHRVLTWRSLRRASVGVALVSFWGFVAGALPACGRGDNGGTGDQGGTGGTAGSIASGGTAGGAATGGVEVGAAGIGGAAAGEAAVGGASGAAPGGAAGVGGNGGSESVPTPDVTVTISNLHEKMVVHTGFLVGTASSVLGITSVEVALDGLPYAPASGTTDWKFKLPTGSGRWRDGSMHTITVRAHAPAGGEETSATLNVRQGNNQDINGDGYPDLAISATSALNTKGQVYVYYSAGAAGVNPSGAGSTITGAATNDRIGDALALADVSGDGYADLIVGSASMSVGGVASVGQVHVFHAHSNGTGLDPNLALSAANSNISGNPSGVATFGLVLSVADVTGDGYLDLIVGAPFASTQQGRVYVFHGSADGTGFGATPRTVADANTELRCTIPSCSLGGSTAVGDVNGDGKADLIVTGSFYPGSGQNPSPSGFVYYAKTDGSGFGALLNVASTPTGSGPSDSDANAIIRNIGGVALGDVNGDGKADLVGAINVNSVGHVYLYNAKADGTGFGSAMLNTATDADAVITGTLNDSLGALNILADVNGDGYDDLVAGSRSFNSFQGQVMVFHAAANGNGFQAQTTAEADRTFTGENTSDRFGHGLSIVDVTGDGFGDLLVGADEFNSFQGKVYVYHSTASSGIGATPDESLLGAVSTFLATSFGAAISR